MPDIPKDRLPEGATVSYGARDPDGDRAPLSVTYADNSGGKRTVKVRRTADGDFIPVTGYTPDGDFNFPGKKNRGYDP